jgi:biotin transporter BioY
MILLFAEFLVSKLTDQFHSFFLSLRVQEVDRSEVNFRRFSLVAGLLWLYLLGVACMALSSEPGVSITITKYKKK